MVKRNTQGAYAERSAASLATATSSLDALCGLHMMSNSAVFQPEAFGL
jgi:hypothetical protein